MNRTSFVLRNVLCDAYRTKELNLLRTCVTASAPSGPSAEKTNGRLPSPSPSPSKDNDSYVKKAPPRDPWRPERIITPGESNLIVGGHPFSFKCGHVARFADGAAVCQIGHTAVLCTAVSARSAEG